MFIFQDSPSNKLLFAKDIPSYRKMVDRYFEEIQEMLPVSDQEMASYLHSVSRVCHENYFIVSACSTNLTLTVTDSWNGPCLAHMGLIQPHELCVNFARNSFELAMVSKLFLFKMFHLS